MKQRLFYILIALLLSIVSFPDLVSNYDLTIDPQIHWVFNWLFENNFDLTQKIIFPHGPLSFLEYPLGIGNNILLSSLFVFTLHFLFAYTALLLFSGEKKWSSIVYLLSIYFSLQYLDFELTLCGLVFLLIGNHLQKKNILFLVLAIIVSAFAFYIKISIGIISASMLASYFMYLIFFGFTSSKKELVTLATFPLLLIVIWLGLYQNIDGFTEYLIGIKELIIGNSDSASLYPDNNWILLSASLLSLIVFPFIGLSKQSKILFGISVLSLLAVWKHSMAREDAWHIMKFGYWIFFIGLTILLNEKKWQLFASLALSFSLGFFYLNARSVTASSLISLKLPKLEHMYNNLLSTKEKRRSEDKIVAEANTCLLSDKDRLLIGDSFVDCYPYNYCFIQANNLQWAPRPIIQSYAAYTTQLDSKNAEHFLSYSAPDYIIWESDILKRDRWQSDMSSIDGRYLMHDEPQTIQNIFSSYYIVSKEENYVLWAKRKEALVVKEKELTRKKVDIGWGTWIPVPKHNTAIQLNAQLNNSLLAKLKSAVYKGEAVFLEFKTAQGIRKQRVTQKHLSQNLLISPLIENLNSNNVLQKVEAVRFTTHTPKFFSKTFPVRFTEYAFYQNDTHISLESILQKSSPDTSYQSNAIPNVFEEEEILQNISPEKYSSTYQIVADSILHFGIDTVLLVSALDFKMSCAAKAKLVIEIQNKSDKKLWTSRSLDKFMHHCHAWEHMYDARKVPLEKGDVIKVYVWNNAGEELSIRDFKLSIHSR